MFCSLFSLSFLMPLLIGLSLRTISHRILSLAFFIIQKHVNCSRFILDFSIIYRIFFKMDTSYIFVNRQCIISLGLIIFTAGIIGNTINIIVFARVRNYRTRPATFYYLIDSTQNILIMLIIVAPRIAYDGFALQLGSTSDTWCKIRRYSSGTLSLISSIYLFLATIDQFFVTSSNVRIRNLSNIKWAHRIIVIVTVTGCLYGIPYFVFGGLFPDTTVCSYPNKVFRVYVPLFIFIVLTVSVSIVLVTFGSLAYRNIQQTTTLADHGAQKQVTRMICMQVIVVVLFQTPYTIYNIYMWCAFGVSASINPNSIEYLFDRITAILTWAIFAV